MKWGETVNTLLDSTIVVNASIELPLSIELALESMIPNIIKINIVIC